MKGFVQTGPTPHPNCRCTACVAPEEPHFPVRSDMLYGVPVLRSPRGVLDIAEGETHRRAETIARTELQRAFDGDTYTVSDVEVHDIPAHAQVVRLTLTQDTPLGGEVLADPADGHGWVLGIALEAGRAGETVPVQLVPHESPAPVPLKVEFTFEDGLHDTLEEMAKQLGNLDSGAVRGAVRAAAEHAEEMARYAMITGEQAPATASRAELKAALDYYLATGRLPTAAAPQPVPVGLLTPRRREPAPPPLQRGRRAMRLRGRLQTGGHDATVAQGPGPGGDDGSGDR